MDPIPPMDATTEEETLDVLIDHNERRWEAEEENARRVSNRTGQLLTLIAALFGLGLFQIGQGQFSLQSLKPAGLALITSLFLGGSVIFLILALKSLLGVRMQDRSGTLSYRDSEMPVDSVLASASLAWPASIAPRSDIWSAVTPTVAKIARFWALDKAASTLHEKNIKALQALGEAQEKLFAAGICAVFAFVCYLFLR